MVPIFPVPIPRLRTVQLQVQDQENKNVSTSSTTKKENVSQPQFQAMNKKQPQFQAMEDPELGFSLPFVQLGLALFKRERNERYMRHLKCRYRPTQKMASHLLKHQTKRRLRMLADSDLIDFLSYVVGLM